MTKLKNNQFGDTIIEVLIALTIISLAVGLAYGVATRSLKSARQSQERLEALKLVEGQVEQIKALSYSNPNPANDIFTEGRVFCIDNGVKVTSPSVAFTDLNNDNLDQYAPQCIINGQYHLGIKANSNGNSNEFSVYARWYGIGGLAKEEVLNKYRVYEE